MAIVLSTIIENHFTALLRLLMRRNTKAQLDLADELFRSTGPLGPFATKVRVAYMLRIIGEETYKDLMIISRIRNRFAHNLSVKLLNDKAITDLIKNMHIYGIVKNMGEEAKQRLEKHKTGSLKLDGPDLTADLIKSHALLSFRDSYRDCLRYIIHHIVDYERSIRETEARFNREGGPKQESSPEKS